VDDALYPAMPAAALEAVGESDVVGDTRALAAAIVELTHRIDLVADAFDDERAAKA
jgi:hypothetical protein